MAYRVKEIYLTLQGEGAQAGERAVFCRFSGCNLWSGRESDRAEAKCWFCDTDFVGTNGIGGGIFKTAHLLAEAIYHSWTSAQTSPLVVFTGGEPLLQLDEALIDAVRARGMRIAVETNGTIAAPPGIDWLTVSPKPKSELKQISGDELKLVYPGIRAPEEFACLTFKHFYLSPLWSADRQAHNENVGKALEYCEENPQWKLTLQLQKILGIP